MYYDIKFRLKSMNSRIYEYKKKQFLEKFDNWKTNFVELKSALLLYESKPLTMSMSDEIQYLIDNFVRENNINIKLYVNQINQKIIIMGRTLEDELIWESIQRI